MNVEMRKKLLQLQQSGVDLQDIANQLDESLKDSSKSVLSTFNIIELGYDFSEIRDLILRFLLESQTNKEEIRKFVGNQKSEDLKKFFVEINNSLKGHDIDVDLPSSLSGVSLSEIRDILEDILQKDVLHKDELELILQKNPYWVFYHLYCDMVSSEKRNILSFEADMNKEVGNMSWKDYKSPLRHVLESYKVFAKVQDKQDIQIFEYPVSKSFERRELNLQQGLPFNPNIISYRIPVDFNFDSGHPDGETVTVDDNQVLLDECIFKIFEALNQGSDSKRVEIIAKIKAAPLDFDEGTHYMERLRISLERKLLMGLWKE